MISPRNESREIDRVDNAINSHSRPSALRITDLRLALVASTYDYPILRIDTNQGVHGLGEVRDAGHVENAVWRDRPIVPVQSRMSVRA